MTVRDFFTAAPFWGLRPQVFPPAVYHDQQGAAASNFNSYRDIPAANVSVLADFPWLLSPAGAIIAIVLGLNLINQSQWGGRAATLVNGVPPASTGATSG